MAVHQYQFCNCNSIVVSCKWIPRADNSIADRLSKLGDCDDRSIKIYVIYLQALITTNASYLIHSIHVQVHVGLLHWIRFVTVDWVAPLPRLIHVPEVIGNMENVKWFVQN